MSKPATIGEIEKDYGVDFGVRPDMRLATYLKREGFPSLSRALRALEKKETEYQMGVDFARGEDETAVCLKKGDRVVVLGPKDYKRKGNTIILKKSPKFYFKENEKL